MTCTLGLVPLLGRSALVQLCVSGESLADRALRVVSAVTDDVVVVRDAGQPPATTATGGRYEVVELPGDEQHLRTVLASYPRVLVHEPLCTFVPPSFLQQLLDSGRRGPPLAGVRPAVDTVKWREGDFVRQTLTREAVRLVTTPVIADADDLARLLDLTRALTDDLGSLVAELSHLRPDLELVEAPSSSRRVGDEGELSVMALSAAGGESSADAQ